jgi:hypothetical protein
MLSPDQNGHGAAVVEGFRTRDIRMRAALPRPAGGSLTVVLDPPPLGTTFATLGFEARPPRELERRAR